MMLGDIGQTLRLASENRLDEAKMRLFHPISFMLASPVVSAAEATESFADDAARIVVEDKYDGIRAQAHIGMHDGTRGVRIFSRTLDDITGSFPELAAPLSRLPGELVLDGEIVAWQSGGHDKAGHALAFSRLQQRLGRKKVTAAMQREVPLAYVIFDVLYANGELIIDRPLRERGALLDEIFANAADTEYVATTGPQAELQLEPAIDDAKTQAPEIIRAPTAKISSAADLDRLFEIARQRGNEGLMIKDLQSAYTPGRRGGAWLKLKRELATLDVVVTIAEYGHGKRAGVLSDYTFAVRDELDPKRLLNVGKAYSGLTDREIQELTQFFLEHTLVDEGFRRIVEPVVVLEVAFNNMMRSDRHESGYALRFPRIVRIRTDKLPGDIDTLATVREIYERQQLPKKP
jgi:DNA ligase-1